MYVMGISGWKNVGKTTLVESLIPVLHSLGASVSTIKHTHHSVDLDQPGKDTYRHRDAGAQEVMLVSSSRSVLMREVRDSQPPSLEDLLTRMTPVDIVLIEGFKKWPHDKIEIYRKVIGGDVMAMTDKTIKAVVTDDIMAGLTVPVFGLNDTDRLAHFVLERAAL